MNQVAFIPQARTLMGPGPSDVHPEILTAMARPTIGHLDPQFIQLMDDIKHKLQWAFQTKNALTLPISAPGSAGMEACFANLVSPGDQVLVCQNGVFGGRMAENVTRFGGELVLLHARTPLRHLLRNLVPESVGLRLRRVRVLHQQEAVADAGRPQCRIQPGELRHRPKQRLQQCSGQQKRQQRGCHRHQSEGRQHGSRQEKCSFAEV